MAKGEFSDTWYQEQKRLKKKERQEQQQQRQKEHQKALQRKNDFHRLLESYEQLLFNPRDLLTTAVIGELKSGKSTFINALLGGNILYSKSSSATAFPVRIVHDVTQKNKISIKYIYNQATINEFISTLDKYDINTKILNTVINFFSTTITKKKKGLNGKDIYSELETLNSILRDLNSVENYPVERLLTSLVPEISLNFQSFSLNGFMDLPTNETFSNIPHKAVFIDTPGLGEAGPLNDLFKWLIDEICQKVDYNIFILEKGGRNTANEYEIVQMLRNSKAFSVVASKLDDYNEDLDFLLNEDIPGRFAKFDNFQKVYGVSQNRFLIANIVLNNFKEYGAIVDTGESYIEDILKDVYGRTEIKKYRKKEKGYEQYLKKNDDYIEVLNDMYLNGKGQEFLHILEDLYVKIYSIWKSKAILNLKETTMKINSRIATYLRVTEEERQSFKQLRLTNIILKEKKQSISGCLAKCFALESYEYIITENHAKRIDNINSIENLINFNQDRIRHNKEPIFKSIELRNLLQGGGLIFIPWLVWDVYHYGIRLHNFFSVIKAHYIHSTIFILCIFFVLVGFAVNKGEEREIADDIKKAPKFSAHFLSYQQLSKSDNVKRINYIVDKILSFH